MSKLKLMKTALPRILLLCLISVLLVKCQSESVQLTEDDYAFDDLPIEQIKASLTQFNVDIETNQYGLVEKGLKSEKGSIQRYDNLARILGRYDVSGREVHEIAKASEGVFNLSHFRRGDEFEVFYRDDGEEKELVAMVYHRNPEDYVVFHLNGKPKVANGSLPVKTKEREVSGVIAQSLYKTLDKLNVHRELVLELSEIYAWQVDFFRIAHGDNFKVIFEERYIDDELIGIGDIKAAIFEHKGEDYYAFRFQQNGSHDYFDEEGNSLRKEFLRAPLEYRRISSRFSSNRTHPVTGQNRAHHGVDYAAPRGTPIYSVGDGVIEEASYTRGNGNYVKIRHNSTHTTMYLHMTGFASGIRPGVEVEQKQVIGYVGATGLATGPHVCFRFYQNGSPVNPLRIEMPPTEPVADENREEFFNVMEPYKDRLHKTGEPQAMEEEEDIEKAS